jgi:hypothetical protein
MLQFLLGVNTPQYYEPAVHFNRRQSGNALLIFDEHPAYLDPSVLIDGEKLNIRLLSPSAHLFIAATSHWTVFSHSKCCWSENYSRKDPGRGTGTLLFPKLLAEEWMQSAAPRNAVAEFKSKEIQLFNLDILLETVFYPSSISERPTCCNVN